MSDPITGYRKVSVRCVKCQRSPLSTFRVTPEGMMCTKCAEAFWPEMEDTGAESKAVLSPTRFSILGVDYGSSKDQAVEVEGYTTDEGQIVITRMVYLPPTEATVNAHEN